MYPFMINIHNKKIVVIGGGKIAAKRILALLPWQPVITVISPKLDEQLVTLANNGIIQHKERTFITSDVEEAFIVIAATNDTTVNRDVKASCASNQLYNIVDDPQGSSFHFPAMYTGHDITVSVATNGISPKLSMLLRDEFAAIIDDLQPAYLAFLQEVRQHLKGASLTGQQKRELLNECMEGQYRTDAYARASFFEKIEKVIKEAR
jgi:precorrin-2 dehydrogenase / sirohydrochlorin ferrochelatase